MDAVFVELKDFAVRTPEQVFRVFFKLYDAARVRAELWHLFGSWAVAREKEQIAPGEQEARVALLFDQLIALAEALEMLKEGKTVSICCVVCGGKRGDRTGED
ncbi:MAG: hypothetical protein JWM28_4215 [Chitinophagaceae bacterium]|nr:hypothetical protein [Chitinophagaceae bacterium]